MVDSPKALAIPHYIGQNGCLPSFYVIFTSTHDDLVEMTRHGRWIITNGSSDQCNGWLQLKTNAFIESNGWLFKSHCHSTLAKMVACYHFTSFLRVPVMTWLRWLDMAAGSLPMDRLTNAMGGYNWKPMLSSSAIVDSPKAIAIPHWPKWLLTNGNWLGRVARKKPPF